MKRQGTTILKNKPRGLFIREALIPVLGAFAHSPKLQAIRCSQFPSRVHVPSRIAIRSPQGSLPTGWSVRVLPSLLIAYDQRKGGSGSWQKAPFLSFGNGGTSIVGRSSTCPVDW